MTPPPLRKGCATVKKSHRSNQQQQQATPATPTARDQSPSHNSELPPRYIVINRDGALIPVESLAAGVAFVDQHGAGVLYGLLYGDEVSRLKT